MAEQLFNFDLSKIADGGAQEKFTTELQKVADNILDLNTESKTKRKVTIDLTFIPNDKRDAVDYWYLFEEPLDGLMRIVCPFIGKEVNFVFDSEETNLKSKQHDPLSLIGLDYSGLPFGELETTQDLIEAILLDQSNLY